MTTRRHLLCSIPGNGVCSLLSLLLKRYNTFPHFTYRCRKPHPYKTKGITWSCFYICAIPSIVHIYSCASYLMFIVNECLCFVNGYIFPIRQRISIRYSTTFPVLKEALALHLSPRQSALEDDHDEQEDPTDDKLPG